MIVGAGARGWIVVFRFPGPGVGASHRMRAQTSLAKPPSVLHAVADQIIELHDCKNTGKAVHKRFLRRARNGETIEDQTTVSSERRNSGSRPAQPEQCK